MSNNELDDESADSQQESEQHYVIYWSDDLHLSGRKYVP